MSHRYEKEAQEIRDLITKTVSEMKSHFTERMKGFLKTVPKNAKLCRKTIVQISSASQTFNSEWKNEKEFFDFIHDGFYKTWIINIENHTPDASFIKKDDLNVLKNFSDTLDQFEGIFKKNGKPVPDDQGKFQESADKYVKRTKESILKLKAEFFEKLEKEFEGVTFHQPSFLEKIFG